jgi:hypothetical protein
VPLSEFPATLQTQDKKLCDTPLLAVRSVRKTFRAQDRSRAAR